MKEDGKVIIDTGLDMSGLKKDIEGLKQVFQQSGMTASLSTIKESVKALDNSADVLEKTLNKTADTLKKDLLKSVKDTSSAMKNDLAGASKDVKKELKGTGDEAKGAAQDLDNLGHKASDVASLLKKGFAVLGASKVFSMFVSGVKDVGEATTEFQSSLNAASTLFGNTQVDMENLATGLLKISSDLKIDSAELGSALYGALSAGIPVTEDMNEAMSFLASSAKTAKGGFADVNTVVEATAATLNAYGLSVEEADRVQGILMQTQNLGITTVGELGETLAQVVPTASAFGVSFEQVGAALATMTASGTKTAQATTSLNSMLSELGKNGQVASKNLTAAAESAGLGEQTFQSLIDDGWNIGEVLQLMDRYAQNSGLSLVDMFGSIEAGRAALQLANGDAEKFLGNLESMENTSGLVDDSFQKVTTGLDHLKVAFDNAKTKIGMDFLGSVDDAAEALGTMIDRFTGNKTAADDLEGALEAVETATRNYQTAQEDAATATDQATQAMLDQSAAAYRVAINKLTDTYSDAISEMDTYKETLNNLNAQQDNAEKGLNNLAKTVGVTREELSRMAAAGELSRVQLNSFQMYAGDFERIGKEIDSTNLAIEKANATIMSFKITMATLSREGRIDLEDYKATNWELYEAVSAVSRSMAFGEETERGFIEANKENASALSGRIETMTKIRNAVDADSESYYVLTGRINALTAALNGMAKAEGDVGKALPADGGKPSSGGSSGSSGGKASGSAKKSVAEIYDDTLKQLADLGKLEAELGGAFDYTTEKASILRAGLEALCLSNEEASTQIADLLAQLNALNSDGSSDMEDINRIFDRTNEALAEVSREEELFGVTTATTSKKVNILKAGMIDLSVYGDDAASQLEALRLILDGLNITSDETRDLWKEIKDYFKDSSQWGKDLGDVLANSLVSGFKALGSEIRNAKKEIESLDESTKSAEEDIAAKQEELQEAQEELEDAKARGNESDAERAQARIDEINEAIQGKQELIKANDAEKKSIENGSEGWKAWGRSALQALAQVLYGVGAQLIAEGVLAGIQLRWADAAIAAAGGAAAIAAGVGLDAAAGAFEEGGIVPQVSGVPSKGDRHIARVNPGELILNEAQQNNLADQIRAGRMLDGLGNSSAGKNINISFQGATLIGLDDFTLAKEIREQINTLNFEGV